MKSIVRNMFDDDDGSCFTMQCNLSDYRNFAFLSSTVFNLSGVSLRIIITLNTVKE